MRFSAIKAFGCRINDKGRLVAALVVLLIGLCLGLGGINQRPAFVHAWAQADRYALALGFVDNGHDLLHPQTAVRNKQFPGTWMIDYGNTVTAVDLPLHEYVVSLLMSLFGTTAPWVFRLLTLLVSMVGMWLLCLLAWRLTGDAAKSLLVVVVGMTSPLYAYYFANYLPSAPALAMAMGGLCAYAAYRDNGRLACWNAAVLLVALASMVRTSQAVLLVAMCLFEGARVVRRESTLRGRWPVVVVAAVAMIVCSLWNMHLRSRYGSLFLNYLTPPRSLGDVAGVLRYVRVHWIFDYFSLVQYWIMAAALVGAVVAWFARRKRGVGVRLSLWWLAAVWWLGELCFFVAMMMQYRNHDYYFLDSFFLPALFVFSLALKALPSPRLRLWPAVSLALVAALAVPMIVGCQRSLHLRCWDGDRAYVTAQRFEGSAQWLDEVGVPRDATILAFMAYPQNGPLVQMGRQGYSVFEYDDNILNAVMQFPFDYVVMEDAAYAEAVGLRPDLARCMVRLAGNGSISLYDYNPQDKD
ncbi:MAG: glycosyltransferase family 39 protein [Bacteroidales bacterium]|nr:glycosyltransferase family 39 protein [Bacteroidales bacterium]